MFRGWLLENKKKAGKKTKRSEAAAPGKLFERADLLSQMYTANNGYYN